MLASFKTGEIVDRLECIKALKVHEVMVYEDQGGNLNYLLKRDPTNSVPSERFSGYEHLQKRIVEGKKAKLEENRQKAHKENFEPHERIYEGAEKNRKKLIRCNIPSGSKYIPNEEEEAYSTKKGRSTHRIQFL
ncbi:hypothetical protein EVAR_89916_1 [Eumeta japonica]|uniref:Uncharacterized protein n=1 Tax=Eumeta variegata TaxID=151549 RepID=A0A4C1XRK1_EUMVA|nr:hypothetical protein EVAR_89916_1 [Eumeta japonica]